MGRFYTNITIKHSDSLSVASAVAPLGRFAVITPVSDGCVVVYDRECDQQAPSIIGFAKALSDQTESIVLAVMNHDDSVLCYWLFDCGAEVDSFNSKPDFFGESGGTRGGDPVVLAGAWGRHDLSDRLRQILHGDADAGSRDRYSIETDRHADIVRTLGLSDWAVGYGYTHLADNEFPEGFPADETFYTEPE